METSGALSQATTPKSGQDARSYHRLHLPKSHSCPCPSAEVNNKTLDERSGLRRHSTPAALMSLEHESSSNHPSVSIATAGAGPRQVSAACSHHVMQQWQQGNPCEEPFNSVVYYAKKDAGKQKPNPA